MPKLVGGLMALFALGAGILGNVDPLTTLLRGAIAFVIGVLATQIWYVFFTVRVKRVAHASSAPAESAPVVDPADQEAAA